MVRWVFGSILRGGPVLHDWCNKGRDMCYPVCGIDPNAYKRTLAANRKE